MSDLKTLRVFQSLSDHSDMRVTDAVIQVEDVFANGFSFWFVKSEDQACISGTLSVQLPLKVAIAADTGLLKAVYKRADVEYPRYVVKTRNPSSLLAMAAWLAPPPWPIKATVWLRDKVTVGIGISPDTEAEEPLHDELWDGALDMTELDMCINHTVRWMSIDPAKSKTGELLPDMVKWLNRRYKKYLERHDA